MFSSVVKGGEHLWLRRYLDVANCITLFNLAVGFAAILSAISGMFVLSFALIIICGAIDHIDGFIARMLNPDDKPARAFGGTLDMISDLVAFSIAPSVALITLSSFSPIAIICGLFYVLCGSLRLVRFEIETASAPNIYAGLPTTYAAYVFALIGLSGPLICENSVWPSMAALILGIFQVSSFEVRKPSIIVTVGLMPLLGISLAVWRII